MRRLETDVWTHQGFSLIWCEQSFKEQGFQPGEAVSLRRLSQWQREWPEELPSQGGDAALVTGLEPCLALLDEDEQERWLQEELQPLVLSFQAHYEGQVALLFWLPSARERLEYLRAEERYIWTGDGRAPLDLGRLLFNGAERDLSRIPGPSGGHDPVKEAAGLHLKRLS